MYWEWEVDLREEGGGGYYIIKPRNAWDHHQLKETSKDSSHGAFEGSMFLPTSKYFHLDQAE